MDTEKSHKDHYQKKRIKYAWKVAIILFFSLSTYDISLLLYQKKTEPQVSLFNIYESQRSARTEESSMYMVGISKKSLSGSVIGDTYLKEHQFDYTSRPILPPLIAKCIYFLTRQNIHLSIFIMHMFFPWLCALLMFKFFSIVLNSQRLAFLTLLLCFYEAPLWLNFYMGRFLDLFHEQKIRYYINDWMNPELTILEFLHVFVRDKNHSFYYHINQFQRFYSPALTLIVLFISLLILVRIYCLREKTIKVPKLSLIYLGISIGLNVYFYPHQIIVSLCLTLVCSVLFKLSLKENLYWITSFLISILPFIVLHLLFLNNPTSHDVMHRIGFTLAVKKRWYLLPMSVGLLLSLYLFFKKHPYSSLANWHRSELFYFSYLITLILVFFGVYSLAFITRQIPQPWLIPMRIYLYLLPLLFVFSVKKIIRPYAHTINTILTIVLSASQIAAASLHAPLYKQTQEPIHFAHQIKMIAHTPSVILTPYQDEMIALLSLSNHFSPVAHGVNSTASNDELVDRFLSMARIYQLSTQELIEWWEHPIQLSNGPAQPYDYRGFTFHHGASIDTSTLVERYLKHTESPCELLVKLNVDYIRWPNRHAFDHINDLTSWPCLESTPLSHVLKVKNSNYP